MTFAQNYRLTEPVGDWQPTVDDYFSSPVGQALLKALDERLAGGEVIYPLDPLRSLRMTPLSKVRVVILGQDPYHGEGEAVGMAFSVPSERKNYRRVLKTSLRKLPGSMTRRWQTSGTCLLGRERASCF